MVEEEDAPDFDDITKSSENVTSNNTNSDGVITIEPTSATKKDNFDEKSATINGAPPSYESLGTTEQLTKPAVPHEENTSISKAAEAGES